MASLGLGWGVSEVIHLMKVIYSLHKKIQGANDEIEAAVSDVRHMETTLNVLNKKVGLWQTSIRGESSQMLSWVKDDFEPLERDLKQAIGLINDFTITNPLLYVIFKMAKLTAIRQNFGHYKDDFVLALSLINTEERFEPYGKTDQGRQVEYAREKIKERSQERSRLQATAERLTESLQSMGPSAIETIARSDNDRLINEMKNQLRDSGISEEQMEQILYPLIKQIQTRSAPTIEFVRQNATFNIPNGLFRDRREEDSSKAYTITREAHFCCDRCRKSIPHGTTFYHCGTCLGGEFDICMTCYEKGYRCFGNHILMKSYRYLLVREPVGSYTGYSPCSSRGSGSHSPDSIIDTWSNQDDLLKDADAKLFREMRTPINAAPMRQRSHSDAGRRSIDRPTLSTGESLKPKRARSQLRPQDAYDTNTSRIPRTTRLSDEITLPRPRPYDLTGASPSSDTKRPPTWIVCVDGSNGDRSIIAKVYLELLRAWTVNVTGQWLFDRVESAGLRTYTQFTDSALSANQRLHLPGKPPSRSTLKELYGLFKFWSEDFPKEKPSIFSRVLDHRSRGLELHHFQETRYFLCFSEEVQDHLVQLRSAADRIVGTTYSQIVLLPGCAWYHTAKNHSSEELEEIVDNVQSGLQKWLREALNWNCPKSDIGMTGGQRRTLFMVLQSDEAAKLMVDDWQLIKIIENVTGCKIRVTREGAEGKKLVTAIGPRNQLREVKRKIERCIDEG